MMPQLIPGNLENWHLETLAAHVAWCGPNTQWDTVRSAAATHPAGKRATAGLTLPRAGGPAGDAGNLDF